MIYTISSDFLTAGINSFGAELSYLKGRECETAYICPEANVNWENISPVLFPNTGLIKDGKALIAGKEYSYIKHGFARQSEFLLSAQSAASVTFTLESSEKTRDTFPFEFALSVTYSLTGRRLTVKTDIHNAGKDRMFFSLGFHPGFTCPIVPEEKAEDYVIAFPTRAYASRLNLESGLVASKTEKFLNGVYELPVKEKMFDNGSFSMTDVNFRSVKLLSKKSGRYVRLDFDDYPNLVLWAPRYKPISVICMEPWYGQPDRLEGEPDVSQKPFTMDAAPGESRTISFSVTCN